MIARVQLLRILIMAGAISAIATLFLPIVFAYFLVGGAPQGGTASPWQISRLLSSMTAMLIGGLTVVAIEYPEQVPRGQLLSVGLSLLLVPLVALVYTFCLSSSLGFHPLGMCGVFCTGLFLFAAAFAAPPRRTHGFQFGLKAVTVWVAFAGTGLAFMRTAAG